MSNYGLLIFNRPIGIGPTQDNFERTHRICCGFLNLLTGEMVSVSQDASGLAFEAMQSCDKTKRIAIASAFLLAACLTSSGTFMLATVVVLSVVGLAAGAMSTSRADLLRSYIPKTQPQQPVQEPQTQEEEFADEEALAALLTIPERRDDLMAFLRLLACEPAKFKSFLGKIKDKTDIFFRQETPPDVFALLYLLGGETINAYIKKHLCAYIKKYVKSLEWRLASCIPPQHVMDLFERVFKKYPEGFGQPFGFTIEVVVANSIANHKKNEDDVRAALALLRAVKEKYPEKLGEVFKLCESSIAQGIAETGMKVTQEDAMPFLQGSFVDLMGQLKKLEEEGDSEGIQAAVAHLEKAMPMLNRLLVNQNDETVDAVLSDLSKMTKGDKQLFCKTLEIVSEHLPPLNALGQKKLLAKFQLLQKLAKQYQTASAVVSDSKTRD